jgi:hypothetical protein
MTADDLLAVLNSGSASDFKRFPSITPFLRRKLPLDDEKKVTLGGRDDVEVLDN